MTPLEVRPLDGAGAEVIGADISTITIGEWNQIEAAFAAFGLLIFPDQIVTEDEHLDFAARWGRIETPRSAGHPAFPNISISPGGGSTHNAEQGVWHADQSYRTRPPLGSVAIARDLPASGAQSRFASTYGAFDALSSGTQRALEALRATHAAPQHLEADARLSDGTFYDSRPPGTQSDEATHPVVIHHPVSGRKTLFVNPTFTTRIEDMEERQGLGLLNQLYDHGQQDEFTTTIDWEPGMVMLWDSRAMWHFTAHSTTPPVMHRVTIAGVELRPAVAPEKADPSLTQRAGATLAGGILTAAMTGIAEVIDPERVKQDIEIVSEAPDKEPLTDLDFGGLPPLD